MSTPEGKYPGIRLWDLTNPAVFIATAAGSGLFRPAPGTWGSLFAALIAYLALLALPESWIQIGMITAAALAFIAGLICTPTVVRRSGLHDPGLVVIDEVAGVWVALACLSPNILANAPLQSVVVCFLLFRCFDILKPGPVGWADSLSGATGVMLDDLLAGMIAGACAFAFLH